MDNLILTMMVAHEEYGDAIGFNKDDIDNIIKSYNYLKKISCNETGYIVLWQNKYIDDDTFANYMDIKFIDDKMCLVVNNFSDVLSKKDYETEIKILDGEDDPWETDYYDVDIDNYFSDYSDDTLQAIIDYCIKNDLEIEDEAITTENTKIVESTIYFKDKELLDYIDEDSLDDLKNKLNWAVVEAQADADRNEAYEKIKVYFEDKVGAYEWKDNKLIIKLDVDIEDVKYFLNECYGEYEFEQENYGNLQSVLNDMEYFDIDTPDYNYIYGTIDNDMLNEYTQNRLSW
jgi:hypothetical protein